MAAATRTAFLRRVESRADSLLRELTEEEYGAGLEAVREWVAAAPGEPVHFEPDRLVYR